MVMAALASDAAVEHCAQIDTATWTVCYVQPYQEERMHEAELGRSKPPQVVGMMELLPTTNAFVVANVVVFVSSSLFFL